MAAKSQGNPFFIEELLNYLHDRGLNPFDAHALESLELPTSLQTLILSRMDQLTEPQKITLKVASVIGRVFPFSWLYGYYPSLGEEDTVREHLAELSKVDLTPLDTPDPELAYLFKHIVTQEVAYESLSYATRAQLHELLARYLESIYPDDPPLDALAFHYSRSENLPKKREFLRKSAEAAYAVYANTTALEYYKQTLALSPEQDELIDIHLKSGEILQMIGRRDDAAAHFHTALQSAEKYNLTEKIIECQIKVAGTLNEYQQSLEWLNKAHDLARQTNNSKGICDVLNEFSNIFWRLGESDTALQHAQQSVDLARQMDDKKREALALFFLASIYSEKGNYAEGHHFFEATLALAREMNDSRRIASTLMNWGTTYYYEGDYKIAEKYISESLTFYREIGDKRSTALALNNLGNIFYLKNDYQTARKNYMDSLTLGRETGDRYTMSLAHISLGITAFQEGNLEEADTHYQQALPLCRALNHRALLSLLHCYLGLLALARGQTGTARECFQEGLTIAHESDMKAYVIYNLIGCGCVYLAEENTLHAVRLLSASSSMAASIGLKIEPELERPYDNALAAAKEKISESDFLAAQDTGKNMTMEQAVHFAISGDGK